MTVITHKTILTPVCKILGAGSEDDMGFQDLVDLGRSTSTNTGSICAALDHWQIPAGRVEIGLGLHNETVSLSTTLIHLVPLLPRELVDREVLIPRESSTSPIQVEKTLSLKCSI